MVEVEFLPNAPIREAVIDIQCNPDHVEFQRLDLNLEGYSSKPIKRLVEVSIHPTEIHALQPAVTHYRQGIRFENEIAGEVVQMREDGFTFSKLAPYKNWQTFVASARQLWDKFQSESGVQIGAVTRIAVRYINVFYIGPGVEFQTYLRNSPETPDETRRPEVEEFFCRMVLPIPEIGGRVILITTCNEPEPLEISGTIRFPLVYDIDVYKEFQEETLNSEEQMWSIFDQMRDIKNEMFFSVVTEEAKRQCR